MIQFFQYKVPKEKIFILKEKIPKFFYLFLFFLLFLICIIFIFLNTYKVTNNFVAYGKIIKVGEKVYGELYIPKHIDISDLNLSKKVRISILYQKKNVYLSSILKILNIPTNRYPKKIKQLYKNRYNEYYKVLLDFDSVKTKQRIQINKFLLFKAWIRLGKENLLSYIMAM